MSRTFLGQNFLIDKNIQRRIVDLFAPKANFGEIGPGEGAITDLLVEKFESFIFFEKDPRLFEKLQRKYPQLKGVRGDFAKWNFELEEQPVSNFSLIGNLPYEAGSQILKAVAVHSEQVPLFLFMLQKEVVERICASPRTSDFGALSVLMQGQYIMEALDIVPPEAFDPAPRVYSQLVRGSLRGEGRHPLTESFQKFVLQSFLQKRKTLRNVWKSRWTAEKIDSVFQAFSLGATARAEELPLDLWPKIHEMVSHER